MTREDYDRQPEDWQQIYLYLQWLDDRNLPLRLPWDLWRTLMALTPGEHRYITSDRRLVLGLYGTPIERY